MVITTAPMRTTGSKAASNTTHSPRRDERKAPAARTYQAVIVAAWQMSAGRRTAAERLPVSSRLSGPTTSQLKRISHATSGPLL